MIKVFRVRNSYSFKKIQRYATMYRNFYYSIFIWSSTCYGRHTAHHQEPETAKAASGFSYVRGCWTCRWWTLSGCALWIVLWCTDPRTSSSQIPVTSSSVSPRVLVACFIVSMWFPLCWYEMLPAALTARNTLQRLCRFFIKWRNRGFRH